MSATAPGRNELCHCGSGKKFKRCCGASAASSAQATQMARDAELSKAMALLQQGRVPQAKKMLASLVIAQPLDPEHHYLLGYAALQEGKHCEAANAMNRALDLGLTDPAAFYHYGCALAAMSQYAEAAAAFEQSLALKPDFLLARTNLANCYFELRDFSAAETQYRQTLAANPRNLAACHNLAQVFSLTQRNDQAIHYFCRAVQAAPQVAELRACLATMQEAENQLDSAEATARSALSDEPHNATAAIVFARVLRRRLEGRGALAALEAADLNASMPRTAIAYWFERGQVLELLGRYRDAFDAFVTCKTALAQARPRAYDGQATEQALLRERLVLTPERILSWALPPQSGRLMPVFIVGFPRSGTTLLEQMLGCHSSIVPCGELETSIEREAGRPDYPDRLVELTDTDREAMFMLWRTDYLEVLTRHAQHTPTARYATDKLPLNLMRIGLIRLLFPQSPIIHVVRHPLDAVLSAYFTAFQFGNDWSLKLVDTAHMFVQSWQQAQAMRLLPGTHYMQVRYEELVSAPDPVLRQVLEFIDLPWEPACLAFQRSKRIARTASYAQVTRPLYQTSKKRYRHYLDYFDEQTLALLEPIVTQAGYEVERPQTTVAR